LFNSAGSAVSSNALLQVNVPATITLQPISSTNVAGSSFTNRVSAIGTGELLYQWLRHGQPLGGATNATLVLTNLQTSHEGLYTVRVTNAYGAALSDSAVLVVVVAARILDHPESHVALAGQTVSLSVTTAGTLPISYRWRLGGSTVTNQVLHDTTSFLTLTNVQLSQAGLYSVVVTNLGSRSSGELSRSASMLVYADHDGDGAGDAWEVQYGFRTNNASDGGLDSDGDGLSNAQEFWAGTDPTHAASALRLQVISSNLPNSLQLNFSAISNRSYAVQFRNSLATGQWQRLVDFPAAVATNRVLTVTDQAPGTVPRRAYRLLTPRVP
jgi:hypothetical protein